MSIEFELGNVNKITSFVNRIQLHTSESFLELEDKANGIRGLVTNFKSDSINWNRLSEHSRKVLESLAL